MPRTEFGGNKLMNLVRPVNRGIQVQVGTDNTDMHRTLARYREEPSGLLRFLDTYTDSSIRAKFWLAQVMREYRNEFAADRVEFLF